MPNVKVPELVIGDPVIENAEIAVTSKPTDVTVPG